MIMRSLRVTVEATTEPVTLEEQKAHCRIETTYEDAVIPAYITVARKYAENYCKRSFARQTYEMKIDEFPGADDGIVIPRPPLSSTSTDVSIAYIDTSAAVQTLGSSLYTIDASSEPAVIRLSTVDDDWPETNDVKNAVTITFAAGYSTSTIVGSTHLCPKPVQHWIKMRVANMIEYREPTLSGEGAVNLRRDFIDGLLDEYRIMEV